MMMMMMMTADSARTHLYASKERKSKIHGQFLVTALPFLIYAMVIPKSDTSSYIDLPSLILPTLHHTVSGVRSYITVITNSVATKYSVYVKQKIKPYI
jgi:hypothetical protein